MEIIFLGSGSALPTKERMLPSIVINREGENFLFDCGEGTQFQMASCGVKPFKIKNIFISHLHGDHIYGLPGLISSMNLFKRTDPLNIFGPTGLKEFLETTFKVTNMTRRYEMSITELAPDFSGGIIVENDDYSVEAKPLEHSLFDLGYRFQEKDKPGHLDLEKAKKFNLPMGPNIGELKRGNSIIHEGKTIHPSDVLGKDIKGKSVTIATDTKYCENSAALAMNSDILIHEATFEKDLWDKAQEMNHSTTVDAAKIAKQAKVKLLIITHISSRNDDIDKLVDECKPIFESTIAAYDFMRITI
jgi:ribonuclease Z